MKRTVFILLGLIIAFMLSVTSAAADVPAFTLQPQNPHYPEYSVAIYTVEAIGDNLTCTWYLDFEGKTYDLCDSSNPTEPWEGYAGSSYGPSGSGNTFHYFFNGIESGLDGAEIYCVIKNGSYSITSDKAIITVMGYKMPPQLRVPAKVNAKLNGDVDIRCIATAPENEQLTYIWYETSTGKLPNIMAISPEPEYSDYWTCDTSAPGTRYYVCGVETSSGGMAYSSVIPVTVSARIPVNKAPKIATDTLPEATAGENYSVQLQCSDANAEFAIGNSSADKTSFGKTGLTLSKSGKLSGTPAAAGEYTFSITASGLGGKDSVTYTLKVNEGLIPITSVAVTDIDAPETGKAPDCFANVSGKGYALPYENSPTSFNGVMWYDITDGRFIELNSEFKAGHEYQVYVQLITEGNYIFNSPEGTVNGKSAEVFGNTGAITACYIFPPCKAESASGSGPATKQDKPLASSQSSASSQKSESKAPAASFKSDAPIASSAKPEVSAPTASFKSDAPIASSAKPASSTATEAKPSAAAPASSAAPDKIEASAPVQHNNGGMPMWGVILCVASAAAAGVGITLAVVSKKHSK